MGCNSIGAKDRLWTESTIFQVSLRGRRGTSEKREGEAETACCDVDLIGGFVRACN